MSFAFSVEALEITYVIHLFPKKMVTQDRYAPVAVFIDNTSRTDVTQLLLSFNTNALRPYKQLCHRKNILSSKYLSEFTNMFLPVISVSGTTQQH